MHPVQMLVMTDKNKRTSKPGFPTIAMLLSAVLCSVLETGIRQYVMELFPTVNDQYAPNGKSTQLPTVRKQFFKLSSSVHLEHLRSFATQPHQWLYCPKQLQQLYSRNDSSLLCYTCLPLRQIQTGKSVQTIINRSHRN
jgi:hypothetical protein